MAQEVLALLDLKGSERILDVGCGEGKITAEIASRVPRGSVVGVDPSRDMIGFAKRHFTLTMPSGALKVSRGEPSVRAGRALSHGMPESVATLRNLRLLVIFPLRMSLISQFRLMPCIGFPTRMRLCVVSAPLWSRVARRSFV